MSRIVPRRGRTDHVTGFLDDCFDRHGTPQVLLTDRGSQFRRTFDKWCGKRKVEHVMSGPLLGVSRPWGEVEAVNKTLGRSFSLEFSSMDDGQRKLDVFMAWYNFIHYNSVIESTPAQAYELDQDQVDVLGILGMIAHTFNLTNLLRGVTRKKRETQKIRV